MATMRAPSARLSHSCHAVLIGGLGRLPPSLYHTTSLRVSEPPKSHSLHGVAGSRYARARVLACTQTRVCVCASSSGASIKEPAVHVVDYTTSRCRRRHGAEKRGDATITAARRHGSTP